MPTTAWTNNWALCVLDYLRSPDGFACDDDEIDFDSFAAAADISDEFVLLTPETNTFTVDAAADEINLSGDDIFIATGDRCTVSNSGGALPSGLAASTNYYWRETGRTSGTFHPSLVDARAGTNTVSISSAGTGTHTISRNAQPRYTCDGEFELDREPLDVLEELIEAGAGFIAYTAGVFKLYAGAAVDPSFDIDETWLRDGEVKLLPRPARDELFNAVRGTFVDPARFYQPGDFPPVTSAAYEEEDGGERIFREIKLPYTQGAARSQRIARILLNRHRNSEILSIPCNWKAYDLEPGQIGTISLAAYGYESRRFRIIEWTQAENGNGFDLVLQADSATIYDWEASQAQAYAAAPATTLFEPWNVAAPTNLVLTNAPYTATGGAVIQGIHASWTAAADAFVSGYEVSYKLSSDGSYTVAGSVAGTDATISGLTLDEDYDVRVRAIRGNGARSTYVTETAFTITGDTTPPAAPTGLMAASTDGGANLTWMNPSDADFSYLRVYRNTVDALSTAVRIADRVFGDTYFDPLAVSETRFYWITACDTSNNESDFNDTDGLEVTAT